MAPFTRTQGSSDYDPDYVPPPSKRRKLVERALSLPPSSPPAPSTPDPNPDYQEYSFGEAVFDSDNGEDTLRLLPPLFPRVSLAEKASGSSIAEPQTPQSRVRAASLEPGPSSPMSVMESSPVKRGRPHNTPKTARLKLTAQHLRSSQRSPDKRKLLEIEDELQKKSADQAAGKAEADKARLQAKEHEKEVEASRKAEESTERQAILDAENTVRAQQVIELITASDTDGGFNFQSLDEFFDALWRTGGDGIISSKITKYVQRHGVEHAAGMFKRSKEAKAEYISDAVSELFQREGRAIQIILTRDSMTTVTDLLKDFSMDQLMEEIKVAAPMLWSALGIISTPDHSTRRANSENRRDKGLVSHILAPLVLRSQRANNFQLVIGLFLLGSGASKREIEVLAHAGLSISYQNIIDHVKKLSNEGLATIQEVVKLCMVQIVWDNLNIAFRVAAERLKSKNHFDNGTMATMIPVFDPSTGGPAAHGTLPLDMKPPRERTLPVLDWSPEDVLPPAESAAQLEFKKAALGECPEVFQIPLHKTMQYPLPAMKLDESTLDGTLQVYFTILQNLGISDKELEVHGLMFDDGDLLTDALKEKLESARRNSIAPIAGMRASCRRWGLFHGQMAGGRLTVNEHWGSPNSLWAGGLWWEHNKLLKRKPLMAGWGGKKATEWRPAHELINISLPAHIVDGFRIYCEKDDLAEWAKTATPAEFDVVAKTVFQKLYSTAVVNELRSREARDITLENAILYNRDALFYVEFTHAIKTGDIGRVLNVLSIWMVMMRSPKTMPRYADAMFETLVRIRSFPPKELYLVNWLVNLTGKIFGFKPVDLLQEHQNFWAKIIYNAKGTNKSWKWLSMITVCIFTLREAMRTVQTAFKIPTYSEKHKTPPIDEEVALIAKALQVNSIQSYIEHRPANDHISPVRDLIKEGAVYANSRKAFHRFTRDARKPEKRGFERGEEGLQNEKDDDGEVDGDPEDYEPTEDDLRVDDEEFLMEPEEFLAAAKDLFDSELIDSDPEEMEDE
ncbi:hypothetical protein K438DRAFT_1958305 [Mycena galopus ATCC 62051]|nr:hypothetical protein K438DRAFT_1958305 [Mycena galopus ATCC 62051]